jgi:hypothetical protein
MCERDHTIATRCHRLQPRGSIRLHPPLSVLATNSATLCGQRRPRPPRFSYGREAQDHASGPVALASSRTGATEAPRSTVRAYQLEAVTAKLAYAVSDLSHTTSILRTYDGGRSWQKIQ